MTALGEMVGRTIHVEVPKSVSEPDEILSTFLELLRGPTNDGQRKRKVGKPLWKIDPDHEAALLRHLGRAIAGEETDPDSGSSPWVHIGWRALALAAQKEHRGQEGWLD